MKNTYKQFANKYNNNNKSSRIMYKYIKNKK